MEENEKMKDWLAGLMNCTSCHLRDEGNRGPTRYSGDCASPLMFVGEGPGGVEDEYGVPLVGPSSTSPTSSNAVPRTTARRRWKKGVTAQISI